MGLRVGTWNVQYGIGAEKNRLRRALLDRHDGDVWVLTETNDSLDLSDGYEPVHSSHRYRPELGGRWVTVWTRLPVVQPHTTDDPSRTVALTVDGGAYGLVTIYGTVLPWQHDVGPDPGSRATGWAEFYRVTPLQAIEWRRLRTESAASVFIVAGDLNHNLGGPQHYGTRRGRALLRTALASADLTCLTEHDQVPTGMLTHPLIDHVCVGAGDGRTVAARVVGWEKTDPNGVALSDHSGVLADMTFGV